MEDHTSQIHEQLRGKINPFYKLKGYLSNYSCLSAVYTHRVSRPPRAPPRVPQNVQTSRPYANSSNRMISRLGMSAGVVSRPGVTPSAGTTGLSENTQPQTRSAFGVISSGSGSEFGLP